MSPNAEVAACTPMPEDAPATAAGSPASTAHEACSRSVTMTEYLLIVAALVAAIAAAVRWWFWREYKAKHADALLFLTHTPHAYQPGKLHDGNVITRLVQVAPTALSTAVRRPAGRCMEAQR